MSKPNQLFLLADHIKLSLLERQRAQNLGLGSDSQDGHVSRSLDQFRDGLASLEQERARLQQAGDQDAAEAIAESLPALRKQLDSLLSQFHGFSSLSAEPAPEQSTSNDPASDPALDASAPASASVAGRKPKTVRFRDTPPSPTQELFGRYRDDPNSSADSSGYSDQAAGMSNQQLHQYHTQIMQEQDDHLDRLGESIGRQRELSMQIGDELENHVAMLDEVDNVVDRHQSRLDRAKRALGKVARGAAENKQMTAIFVLIVILVLLIAILK